MPEIAILRLCRSRRACSSSTPLRTSAFRPPYQFCNKDTYGHPGGVLHAGIHVALTPFVYLVLVPAS